MSDTLRLHVKGEYFSAIKSGEKHFEYRLRTPYWNKRIENREYKYVEIILGYPKKSDQSKRLLFLYAGYEYETLTHPHFGERPVDVYAIHVCRSQLEQPS